MNNERTCSAGRILAALGKAVLYVLFFLAAQIFVSTAYAAAAAVRAALIEGETDVIQCAEAVVRRLLAGVSEITLLSDLFAAAALLLWFKLRRRPLAEAAGLRRCSGWTAGFCAFGAMGLFVLVNLALALLPESWMAGYTAAMEPAVSTGLLPALAIVIAAPLAEELVFRGVVQSRLEQAMPNWAAVAIQAALFGLIHGVPVQIGYAIVIGLIFGWVRCRTGSILPGAAAHAAFNAMNDPLGLLGGMAESWYFLAVMAAVCAAGCFFCRRGLAALEK